MTQKLAFSASAPTELHQAFAYWKLQQQNPAVGLSILEIAHKLGIPNPTAWGARLLDWCSSKNVDFPLFVRLLGLRLHFEILQEDGQDGRALSTELDKRKARTAIQEVLSDWAKAYPTSAAASPPPEARRTEAQARMNFNQPKHWVLNALGEVVPDENPQSPHRLTGASKSLWSDLKATFGPALSASLFNALVLGDLNTMLSVMDQKKSGLPLTAKNVADFQYVVHTNNQSKATKQPLKATHDFYHAVAGGYGVGIYEETVHEGVTAMLIEATFGRQSFIDLNSQEILGFLLTLHQSNTLSKLEAVIELNLQSKKARQSMFRNWTQTDAAQRESTLKNYLRDNGFLAHLSAPAMQRVMAKIFSPSAPDGFAAWVGNSALTPDSPEFLQRFDQWVSSRLAPALAAEANMPGMPFDEFKRLAAKTLAAALIQERASKFSLIDGDRSDMGMHRPGGRAFQSVDLRTTFPQTLQEVNAALGIAP